jgi:hypothetical protein
MDPAVTPPPDVPRATRRPRVLFWTVILLSAAVALVALCLGGFTLATRM